jgi:hypothetical protein
MPLRHRKLLWRTAAVAVVLLVLATGVVLALVFPGEEVYNLDAPQPATAWQKTRRLVARRVGPVLLPFIYHERTTYAPGFREEAFRSLTVGMSEKDVRKALGEPLARRDIGGGRSVLYYSQQATSRDNYLVRNLVFDAQGRLLERRAEFYVD